MCLTITTGQPEETNFLNNPNNFHFYSGLENTLLNETTQNINHDTLEFIVVNNLTAISLPAIYSLDISSSLHVTSLSNFFVLEKTANSIQVDPDPF